MGKFPTAPRLPLLGCHCARHAKSQRAPNGWVGLHHCAATWGSPRAGGFRMEDPIKWMILGVPIWVIIGYYGLLCYGLKLKHLTNIWQWVGIHVVFAVRTYILEQMGVSAAMGIWLDLMRPRMVLLFDKIGCSNAKIGCFNQQTV